MRIPIYCIIVKLINLARTSQIDMCSNGNVIKPNYTHQFELNPHVKLPNRIDYIPVNIIDTEYHPYHKEVSKDPEFNCTLFKKNFK